MIECYPHAFYFQEVGESGEKCECLLFDGKTDLTKVMIQRIDGKKVQGTAMEEHITMVGQPGDRFLGHLAPSGRDAVTISDAIFDFVVDNGYEEELEVVGGDSTVTNTGHKGGIINLIEKKKGRRLLIVVCNLHCNELPLRHLIKARDIHTLSNNKFGGPIGELIGGDVEKMAFNPHFKRIKNDGPKLPALPPEVVKDLSNDQQYGFRLASIIVGGEVDANLLTLKPGPISHARWLTTANRFMRIYVGKHGLTGKEKKDLTLIVTFIVTCYYVIWFDIKCHPTTVAAPGIVFKQMQIVKHHLPKAVQEVVKSRVADSAWYAHPEHLLLHLLASQDEENRRFAVKKILEIRGDSEFGDTSPRPFKVPPLNWSAKTVRDMIIWTGATEPIFTAAMTCDQVRAHLDAPFVMKAFPAHTQSVERMVKEVSAASSNVFGLERRNGYVHARLHAREVAPDVTVKAGFLPMLS